MNVNRKLQKIQRELAEIKYGRESTTAIDSLTVNSSLDKLETFLDIEILEYLGKNLNKLHDNLSKARQFVGIKPKSANKMLKRANDKFGRDVREAINAYIEEINEYRYEIDKI